MDFTSSFSRLSKCEKKLDLSKYNYIKRLYYSSLENACASNDERQKISVSAEKSARSAILAAREIASSPSNYMAHEKLSYAFSVWRMEGDWNSTT